MKKTVIERIKALFEGEESASTMDVKTVDGAILRLSEMAVGATAFEVTEEGEVAVEDGDYVLEDGTVLTIADGLVTELVMPMVDEDMEDEDAPAVNAIDVVAVDGTEMHIVTAIEGEITVGDVVDVADGVYEIADGMVLTVADGAITEIAVVVEDADVTVTEEFKAMNRMVKRMNKKISSMESKFESLSKENLKLKQAVLMFANAESATPTKTVASFKANQREEKLKFFGRK